MDDLDAVARSRETALGGFEKTLTQQHFKEEVDINNILARAAQTGVLPVNDKAPVYGDFSMVPTSLHEAFAMIKQANDLFMALPWQAREKFKNNPEEMVSWLQKPENREEAIAMGLVKAPVVDAQLETLKSIDASLKAGSGSSGAKPEGGAK